MSDYRAKHWYSTPEVASTYEERRFGSTLGRLRHRWEMAALWRALAVLPNGSQVLDVACGSGRILRELFARNLRAVGADISPSMLEEVEKRLGHPEALLGLVLCEAEHLPFPDNSFDAVTCIRLLSHLPPSSRAAVLAETRRVARQWVIVSCSVEPLALKLWHGFQKLTGRMDKTPWFPVTVRGFRRELEAAGLALERVEALMPFFYSSRIFLAKVR